jgi:hypothetical protein
MRLAGIAVTMVALLGGRAVAAPPNTTCVAICTAPVAEPLPACPACEATNVCSDLRHTDPASYATCTAAHEACYQDAYDCQRGSEVGLQARDSCTSSASAGSGTALPACCAAACAPRLMVAPFHSAGSWVFVDFLLAGLVRHRPGDYSGQVAVGGLFEVLFGSRAWRGHHVPFRLGPFVSATANFDTDEDVALQLSAGLTALVAGSRRDMDVSARPVLVSAGVIVDAPPVLDNRIGGLARISVGVTTTGQNQWKFLSGWLYLEGHFIPGGDAGDDRTEVLLGLRLAPFVIPMALIPNLQDR